MSYAECRGAELREEQLFNLKISCQSPQKTKRTISFIILAYCTFFSIHGYRSGRIVASTSPNVHDSLAESRRTREAELAQKNRRRGGRRSKLIALCHISFDIEIKSLMLKGIYFWYVSR
jgi:hypothetical protein